MFLRQSIRSTNKILQEIAVVLECENAGKFSKLARSARSHIHRFLSMLVALLICRYTVVYSAIPLVIKQTTLIERNSSFRNCEMRKSCSLRSLAYT